MICENLIRELQYLWWNVLLAIGTKKEVREILNVNYQLAAKEVIMKNIPHTVANDNVVYIWLVYRNNGIKGETGWIKW